MIKVTELVIQEDYENAIDVGNYVFETLEAFEEQYDFWIGLTMGEIVEQPEYRRVTGEAVPKEYVQRFLSLIDGRKGVLIECLEWTSSSCWWFIEIDEEDKALMLTSPEPLIRQIVTAS